MDALITVSTADNECLLSHSLDRVAQLDAAVAEVKATLLEAFEEGGGP